jgi:hypothetical protein
MWISPAEYLDGQGMKKEEFDWINDFNYYKL